jgi:Ca2+-binding EF-hand superfamily protein
MSSVSSTTSTSYYYAVQKKAFDKLDADQNGSLSEREYQAGQPKTASKDKVVETYDALDADASAGVSLDEYVGGVANSAGSSLLGQLSSGALDVLMQLRPQDGSATGGGSGDAVAAGLFEALDGDADGQVSADEFQAGHPAGLTASEAGRLFIAADADQDGFLTQDDMTLVSAATTPPRLRAADMTATTSAANAALLSAGTETGANSALRLFDLLDAEAAAKTAR